MLCSVCLSPCQTCLNASFCLTCSSGMVLAGACLSLCPDGWFELSGQCLVCNSTCRTCLNASACLSCNTSGLTPVYY